MVPRHETGSARNNVSNRASSKPSPMYFPVARITRPAGSGISARRARAASNSFLLCPPCNRIKWGMFGDSSWAKRCRCSIRSVSTRGDRPWLDGAHDVRANHLVALVVIPQGLVQLVKFHARVGIGRRNRAKTGWTDQDLMRERPRGSLGFRVHTMANRAALHENDRVVTVLASHRGRQTGHKFRFGAADDQFKTPR